MSSESKFTKYSENRQTTHDKLEELQIELDEITTNVTSGRYINLKDIDRAFKIEVDAEKLKRKMDIETKKIQANADVQRFLKNQDNSFEYDIDRQVEQVDEIYGFIMEAFKEFTEFVIQHAISHSRPDLLKYTLKKMRNSRKPSIVRDKRRTRSANRASRKKHSSRKRRHSAK